MKKEPSATESASEDALWIATILERGPGAEAEECYARLLRKYWKLVTVLAISRVGDRREAEDISQEAFIRAFRSLGNLSHPVAFLGWLLRITRNLITDHIRSRKPHVSLDAIDPVVDTQGPSPGRATSADPRDDLESREEMELVLHAVGELPEHYREVVVLRYLQGLDGKSMARLLDEPEGTVRNRLFRALEKLRESLEKRRLRKS